jgi:hypothetical protein
MTYSENAAANNSLPSAGSCIKNHCLRLVVCPIIEKQITYATNCAHGLPNDAFAIERD